MFCQVLEQVIEFFGAAITKKPHFLPKIGQKKPSFGLQQCFWGVSGQLKGSPPYFEVFGLTKFVLQGFGAGYGVFWSHHHQKNRIFCPKMAKKSLFLA